MQAVQAVPCASACWLARDGVDPADDGHARRGTTPPWAARKAGQSASVPQGALGGHAGPWVGGEAVGPAAAAVAVAAAVTVSVAVAVAVLVAVAAAACDTLPTRR